MTLQKLAKKLEYIFNCKTENVQRQRNGNKKSDSVCFTDNSNNINTL